MAHPTGDPAVATMSSPPHPEPPLPPKQKSLAIMPIAPMPGLGKTTLQVALQALLTTIAPETTVQYIAQDTYMHGKDPTNSQHRTAGAKAYGDAIAATTADIVLLDKGHHTTVIRENTRQALPVGYELVFVTLDTPTSAQRQGTASNRISRRDQHHQTLKYTNMGKLFPILQGFEKSAQPLTPEETQSAAASINLNAKLDREGVLHQALEALAPVLAIPALNALLAGDPANLTAAINNALQAAKQAELKIK